MQSTTIANNDKRFRRVRDTEPDAVWTSRDVGLYLKMSSRTVTHLAGQGRLPGKQIGTQWRFSRRKIEALMADSSAYLKGVR